MGRPCKYRTEEEREAAKRESRRKWREAHPEKWAAILARSYLRRRDREAKRRKITL